SYSRSSATSASSGAPETSATSQRSSPPCTSLPRRPPSDAPPFTASGVLVLSLLSYEKDAPSQPSQPSQERAAKPCSTWVCRPRRNHAAFRPNLSLLSRDVGWFGCVDCRQ